MKSFPVRQWVVDLGVVFLPCYCLFVHGIGLTQTRQCRNSKDEPASARPLSAFQRSSQWSCLLKVFKCRKKVYFYPTIFLL